MAFADVGKLLGSLGVVAGVIFAVASCDDPNDGYYRAHDCDYVETRCNNVCDYTCDYYSCYPTCWNQCWDVCGRSPRYPGATSSSGAVPVTDAGAPSSPPSPPWSDAGASSGSGVLCTSCVSNSDCETGALCILRGGARDAGATDSGTSPSPGRGFCGSACTTSQDCPDGFLCSQLGSTRQCLPTGNACE